MGCTAVGFVMTSKKPVFDVMGEVMDVVYLFCSHVRAPKLHARLKLFMVDFEYKGTKRSLSVRFDRDDDYSNVSFGDKIIFSTSAAGGGSNLVFQICAALTRFGYVYYTPNDCENEFELFGMED